MSPPSPPPRRVALTRRLTIGYADRLMFTLDRHAHHHCTHRGHGPAER
jgi:hypothetical protein